MEVGHGGSRGQTEVAIKLHANNHVAWGNGRERGPILAGEITPNVSMVTLRKRRAIGTNLGQNQRIMPMAACLSRLLAVAWNGKILIVVVIEL